MFVDADDAVELDRQIGGDCRRAGKNEGSPHDCRKIRSRTDGAPGIAFTQALRRKMRGPLRRKRRPVAERTVLNIDSADLSQVVPPSRALCISKIIAARWLDRQTDPKGRWAEPPHAIVLALAAGSALA